MTSTRSLLVALRDLFQTTLPPLIAAEGLPAVHQVLLHTPDSVNSGAAPLIWCGPYRIEPQHTDGADGQGAIQRRVRHFRAGATYKGAGGDETVDYLTGYADLMLSVLEANPTLGGAAWQLRVVDVLFAIPASSQSVVFQEVVLYLEIERQAHVGED